MWYIIIIFNFKFSRHEFQLNAGHGNDDNGESSCTSNSTAGRQTAKKMNTARARKRRARVRMKWVVVGVCFGGCLVAEVSPWNEMPNEFLLCTQIVCGMRHWKHQAGGHIFLNKKKQSKGDIAVRSMDRSPLARRVAESRVIMYTHVANYVGADLIMKNGQRFNSNDKYSALPGILFSIFFSFIIRLFATSMASKSRSVFFPLDVVYVSNYIALFFDDFFFRMLVIAIKWEGRLKSLGQPQKTDCCGR